MTLGERIEHRRKELGIRSQAELARLAGIGQSTINGLIRKPYRWSPYLPQIARVLATSVEYLVGESSDADATSFDRTFRYDDHRLIEQLHTIGANERRLIEQITTAFAGNAQRAPSMQLPGERPLTAMFEALLAGINPSLPQGDKARLLAQRLPIALAQLQDLQPESDIEAAEASGVARPIPHPEQTR